MARQRKTTATPHDAGSRTAKPTADAPASRCPKCGSTDRTPYSHTRRVDCNCTDDAGRPYNQVVFRNTTCAACGQARVDRTRELV